MILWKERCRISALLNPFSVCDKINMFKPNYDPPLPENSSFGVPIVLLGELVLTIRLFSRKLQIHLTG